MERTANLMELCIDSLRHFYIQDECMFARSIQLNTMTNRLEMDSSSPRNTATVLVALNKMKNLGYDADFNTDEILRNLVQHHIDQLDYEDISLTLWADSVGNKQYLDSIWTELAKRCMFFTEEPSGKQYGTMRMGWLLTALCHHYPVAGAKDEVQELAYNVKQRITENYNTTTNLFYGSNRLSRRNLIKAKYHKTLTTLSSQTFTIMALALYSQVFDDSEALQMAVQCADTLCRLQGDQGQWWWVYNVNKGKVAEKYPVYSVNQDGAVPMALFALQQVLSVDKYDTNIRLGLEWILGKNELNEELVDWDRRLIWRGIRRRQDGKLGTFGLGVAGRSNAVASAYLGGINTEKIICPGSKFRVIEDMYSYHPARFIIAFAEILHEQKRKPGVLE